MKNIKSVITNTAMIFFSIPVGRYFLRVINLNGKEIKSKNNTGRVYDLSLRNFHPDKGE